MLKNKIKNKIIFFVCLMFFFQLPISAQEKNTKTPNDTIKNITPKPDTIVSDSVITDTTKKTKKLSIISLPLLYYTPETSVAGGGFVLFLFKTAPNTRVSTLDITTVGTIRKQLLLDFTLNLFTKENKYFIKSEINFAKFPDNFYGIGNNQPTINDVIDYKLLRANFRILHKLPKGFFVGMKYQFYQIFDLTQDKNAVNTDFIGNKGSLSSGAGLIFSYDTRDNLLNPRKGAYFEISTYHYAKIFGTEFVSNQIYIDARKYFKLNKRGVLAMQFIGNFNTGDTPFKLLAPLGGALQMRGYYNGRYRDNIAMILQAEYRHILTKRWGFTVFTAVGDVGKNFADFASHGLKLTGGAGVRFKLSQKDNVNFRLDVAGGIGSPPKPYFNLAEAY